MATVDDSLGSTVCGWDICKENGGRGREVFGTLEAVYQEGYVSPLAAEFGIACSVLVNSVHPFG